MWEGDKILSLEVSRLVSVGDRAFPLAAYTKLWNELAGDVTDMYSLHGCFPSLS